MPGTRFTRSGHGLHLAVLLILLIAFAVGLVGLFPIALDLFRGDVRTWERLSLISQTYGAASAFLSAFALLGIALTPILQGRQNRMNREKARRALHIDLLKMALEDPIYQRAWGFLDPTDALEADLQRIYFDLIISDWQTSFHLRTMDEPRLRMLARGLFQGEGGRRFWAAARETRITTSTRRERRFHQIVDDEFRAAERQGPPGPGEPRRRPAIGHLGQILIGTVLGGICVLLADRILRSSRGTRRHRR